jgi:hypothetical protein
MPNHITNVLSITGDAKLVEELRQKVYKMEKATEKTWNHEIGDEYPTMDFGGTVPFPKELEGTTSGSPGAIPDEEKKRHAEFMKKYGAVNWYDWNIKNWGTKWNAYDVDPVETIENGLKFRFNTAWASPSGWLLATAQLYPSLNFEDWWKDEGGGCGIVRLCIEDDMVEDEDISDHDWYYEFDPSYVAEYDLITEGDYQTVLDKYKDETELNYSILQEPLLERIEDKDLPLFMKLEWYGDEKELFVKRLKGEAKQVKAEPPKRVTRKIRWKEND